MGGTYNREEIDGLQVDTESRRVDVLAFDLNTTINKTGTRLIGEMATFGGCTGYFHTTIWKSTSGLFC